VLIESTVEESNNPNTPSSSR